MVCSLQDSRTHSVARGRSSLGVPPWPRTGRPLLSSAYRGPAGAMESRSQWRRGDSCLHLLLWPVVTHLLDRGRVLSDRRDLVFGSGAPVSEGSHRKGTTRFICSHFTQGAPKAWEASTGYCPGPIRRPDWERWPRHHGELSLNLH